MAPGDELNPEGIARAVAALPAALFVGDVSGPLNAEASALARQLDPKLEQIKTEIDATLELCHAGNEPSAGPWQENVEAVRAGDLTASSGPASYHTPPPPPHNGAPGQTPPPPRPSACGGAPPRPPANENASPRPPQRSRIARCHRLRRELHSRCRRCRGRDWGDLQPGNAVSSLVQRVDRLGSAVAVNSVEIRF
eukprot:jgi/Undpi1/4828/HiC_scaffold_19.g08181.m1